MPFSIYKSAYAPSEFLNHVFLLSHTLHLSFSLPPLSPSQAGCCVTDVSGKAFCSSERSKRATPTASTIFDLLQIKYTCQGGGAKVTEYCQSAQLSLWPGPGGADYPESRCLLEVSAEFTDRTSKEHVRLRHQYYPFYYICVFSFYYTYRNHSESTP
jgi:hypothetical protein